MIRLQHRLILLATLGVMIPCFLSAQSSDPAIEKKIDQLLAKMTLEEKIGQMTQVAIQVVSKTQGTAEQDWELDSAKLDTAINHYGVGSLLNVWDKALSVEDWHTLITEIQDRATQSTRLGIPVLYGIDAIHGANYTKDATLFPQSINMAATWNPELVEREGEITALEMRASGIPWNFNPVLGVGRHPAWPRLWETYGEDPYVATVLGEVYVRGQQGDNPAAPNKVAACAKHYLGYSFPLSGKDRTPAWIPDRMLREIFLPPFKASVDAGVLTFMANSSEINGVPVHSSYYYLTEILRDELGFNGIMVSDWADINNLFTREKVAGSPKEAVRIAVMAGVDMSMVPLDFSFYHLLLELAKEGSVPESRIDEAVRRILRVKFQLGLFENPYPDDTIAQGFASEESQTYALQAARESLILAKNDNGILPLSKSLKVFVTGPTANSMAVLNGGWTITWQGNEESLYPKDKPTILKAIQQKIGEKQVSYQPGVEFDKNINIKKAVSAARKADVAVVCLGEPTYCEMPGNINDLTMSRPQLELFEAISKTGVPIVLVLAEGRPRLINDIADKANAILLGFLPGTEGGEAIADVLFGDVNPSGKLPVTYPRHPNDLTLYDYRQSQVSWPNEYNPQFAFGHGLSYTTFEYSDLTVDKKTLGNDESLQVYVTVTNTGDRAGKEAVLLFISDPVRSVTPPVRQLKRFEKIALEAGESRTVNFNLSAKDLAFVGRDNKWITEPGEFVVQVHDLTATFELRE